VPEPFAAMNGHHRCRHRRDQLGQRTRGAVLEGAINWDGVKAGRKSRVEGSILGRHVVVHHDAVVREDAVIGDRTEVGAYTLVPPGARVEPRSILTPDAPGGVPAGA